MNVTYHACYLVFKIKMHVIHTSYVIMLIRIVLRTRYSGYVYVSYKYEYNSSVQQFAVTK